MKIRDMLYALWGKLADFKTVTSGGTTDVSVPANGYADVNVSFGKTYSSKPNVSVCLLSTSTASAIGNVSAAVLSITTTGATFRVFNAGTQLRVPSLQWIAVGGGVLLNSIFKAFSRSCEGVAA